MATRDVHQCQCPDCQSGADHPEQEIHHQMNLLCSRLDEQQRRWFAALEAKKLGHGGDTVVAGITGLHVDTIRRGREELEANLTGRPTARIRTPGAGRPTLKKRPPPRGDVDGPGRPGDGRRPDDGGQVPAVQLADA